MPEYAHRPTAAANDRSPNRRNIDVAVRARSNVPTMVPYESVLTSNGHHHGSQLVEQARAMNTASCRPGTLPRSPARPGSAAFARGNEIHVAPGQERHLPIEAWHVVQQAQGRVSGGPIIRDTRLEHEADAMGTKAQAAGTQAAAATNDAPRSMLMPRPKPTAAQPMQLQIADDLRGLGQQAILDALGHSARAMVLIQKADRAGVAIMAAGHGGPQTARQRDTGRIIVSIPVNGDPLDTAQALMIELQNALRQKRFDALIAQSRSGEIADEDEYARKKMEVEIAGMVETGKIGDELIKAGGAVPINRFYISELIKYQRYWNDNPLGSLREFSAQYADTVLDTQHAQGSHRVVYTEQFRSQAGQANATARADNDRQRKLASQVRAMSAILGREQAVSKLWHENHEQVPALFDYLSRQSASAANAELRLDLVRGLAPLLNAKVANSDQEQFIVRHPDLMRALYAWLEANDQGQYRALTQILGISLGYHRDHPERLTSHIYG